MEITVIDDRPRGIRVDGDRIRFLRLQHGWTQRELASRSGYCDRLIRKAEQGGILSAETIDTLAETLSCERYQVTPHDLCRSARSTLFQLQSLLQNTKNAFEHDWRAMLDDSVKVNCRGPQQYIPFAGTFQGISAFQAWLALFLKCVVPDPNRSTETIGLLQSNHAFLHNKFVFVGKRAECDQPIDLDMRLTFAEGLIKELIVNANTIELVDFYVRNGKPDVTLVTSGVEEESVQQEDNQSANDETQLPVETYAESSNR